MRAYWMVAVYLAVMACDLPTKTNPGHCRMDSECPAGQRCDVGGTYRCGCGPGGCPDGGEARDGGQGDGRATDGGGCLSSASCPAERPVCANGRCVACEGNADCKDPNRAFCVASSCAGCAMAGAGACAAATPVCGSAGACVECAAHGDCKTSSLPVCDPAGKCQKCTSDTQCAAKGSGPGICMSHQDGRCAAQAETLYVEKSPVCDSTPAAICSAVAPCCSPQQAIDLVDQARRVIVVRGAVAGVRWAPGATNRAVVSVVGERSAALVGGIEPGVRLTAGDLYLRSIVVRTSDDTGVIVTSQAKLYLDRVMIQNNAKGGVLVDGGSLEMRNSSVVGNGPGQVGTSVWGGILLQSWPPGATPVLDRATVTDNKAPGIVCQNIIQGTGVFATGNAVTDMTPNCGFTLCPSRNSTCGAEESPP